MKNLIRRILKENFDPENFDWVEQDVKEFNPAEQFLYDIMSNLTISESKNLRGWVVYKDKMGEILMADNINTGTKKPVLYVDYDQIWVKLRDNYGLSYEEAMVSCARLLEITHKRKVLAAPFGKVIFSSLLEITHKRKVFI